MDIDQKMKEFRERFPGESIGFLVLEKMESFLRSALEEIEREHQRCYDVEFVQELNARHDKSMESLSSVLNKVHKQEIIKARIEELERQHTNCQVEAWVKNLPKHISERIEKLKGELDDKT